MISLQIFENINKRLSESTDLDRTIIDDLIFDGWKHCPHDLKQQTPSISNFIKFFRTHTTPTTLKLLSTQSNTLEVFYLTFEFVHQCVKLCEYEILSNSQLQLSSKLQNHYTKSLQLEDLDEKWVTKTLNLNLSPSRNHNKNRLYYFINTILTNRILSNISSIVNKNISTDITLNPTVIHIIEHKASKTVYLQYYKKIIEFCPNDVALRSLFLTSNRWEQDLVLFNSLYQIFGKSRFYLFWKQSRQNMEFLFNWLNIRAQMEEDRPYYPHMGSRHSRTQILQICKTIPPNELMDCCEQSITCDLENWINFIPFLHIFSEIESRCFEIIEYCASIKEISAFFGHKYYHTAERMQHNWHNKKHPEVVQNTVKAKEVSSINHDIKTTPKKRKFEVFKFAKSESETPSNVPPPPYKIDYIENLPTINDALSTIDKVILSETKELTMTHYSSLLSILNNIDQLIEIKYFEQKKSDIRKLSTNGLTAPKARQCWNKILQIAFGHNPTNDCLTTLLEAATNIISDNPITEKCIRINDTEISETESITPVNRNIKTYERNPEVPRLVRLRANGNCELCHNNAPFQNDNGDPFLEVHHIVPLSAQGRDTTANCIALCPNCHRHIHFGSDRQDLTMRAQEKIQTFTKD